VARPWALRAAATAQRATALIRGSSQVVKKLDGSHCIACRLFKSNLVRNCASARRSRLIASSAGCLLWRAAVSAAWPIRRQSGFTLPHLHQREAVTCMRHERSCLAALRQVEHRLSVGASAFQIPLGNEAFRAQIEQVEARGTGKPDSASASVPRPRSPAHAGRPIPDRRCVAPLRHVCPRRTASRVAAGSSFFVLSASAAQISIFPHRDKRGLDRLNPPVALQTRDGK